MNTQFSERSALKRLLIWFAIQTPILLYVLTAASLSSWYEEPTNPLSAESIQFIKLRPNPLHDAIVFLIFSLIGFATIFFFATWRTKRNNIGMSGHFAILTASFLYGIPMLFAMILFGSDIFHNVGLISSRDRIAETIEKLYSNELFGFLIGVSIVLLTSMIATWKRPKQIAMQRMCLIAGISAVFYICIGMARLVLSETRPALVYPPYYQHYDLIGIGAALLSLAIGLRWVLIGVYKFREQTPANLCRKCDYDLAGIKNKCPECGTEFTPQTS